ncbi:hypothetical protein ROTAS13_02829 [Roseomonas sp. TAS13]|nr:hypothetical protein ROTAS13_02829 [Roseomonas sp. TAS13]
MVQIGARVPRAGRAVAFRVEGARVLGEFRVPQVHHAARGIGPRGAAGARRDHAVEHVDAAPDGADDVGGRADAHQVARLVPGQQRRGDVEGGEHHLLPLADREAADRIALEADPRQRPHAFGAQAGIDAALHDAEEAVAGAGHEGLAAAGGPEHGLAHGPRSLLLRGGEGGALVQAHGDVGIQQVLDLDGTLGREAVLGAVDMRMEGDAVGIHLPQLAQRHDLEAAGIRQDRAGPVHHAVQPAQAADALRAGAQHQVIGVAQDHAGAGGAHRVGGHRLHRAGGAHGHEDRRRHLAMRGVQRAGTGAAIRGLEREGKGQGAESSRRSSEASP